MRIVIADVTQHPSELLLGVSSRDEVLQERDS